MQNCIFYLPFLTVFCLFSFFHGVRLIRIFTLCILHFCILHFCILHYSNQLLSVRRSRADGDS